MDKKKVPVLVTDLNETESKTLLATLDPIGAMAQTDQDKLNSLIQSIQTGSDAVADYLDSLRKEDPDKETVLKNLDVKQPPKMSWVLVGIPTVRFGELSQLMESVASIDGVSCVN